MAEPQTPQLTTDEPARKTLAPVARNAKTPSIFRWGNASFRAALMIADGRLTDAAIAKAIGVTEVTLHKWTQHPTFQAQVDDMRERMYSQIMQRGCAVKAQRVAQLQAQLDRLLRIVAEREAAYAKAATPKAEGGAGKAVAGGQSGFLCREPRLLGKGADAKLVSVYRFDAALSKEIREILKQIAQEKGEWVEHKDVTSGGKPFKTYLMNVDDV